MLFGLIYCFVIALIATSLSPLFGAYANPMLLAIVLGMILGNTLYPRHAHHLERGIAFAKKTLLRSAIVLYGLRVSMMELGDLGISALLLDALMLVSTFFLTVWLAKHIFAIDQETAILMGSGASICGAAAVLAAESVIKPEPHKSALAVATVVLFGTLSLLVYPLLYASQWLPLSPEHFGIYIGAAVHEVAQVVAAGGMIGESVAQTAIISKMTRVLLLAPFLLALSFYWQRHTQRQTNAQSSITFQIPHFALGFVGMVFLNSYLPQSALPYREALIQLDQWMLTTAMVALGLSTQFKALWSLGIKPFALGFCVFLWLLLGGAGLSVLLL
ncbi:MAG: YeiH family protein [Cardiobacteriaceae bacterium]|nr:YeiH family protein [Cardiobacteriaceae bacterium]